MTILTMVQEKYTYLKELEECREKPFNELLFNEIAGADFSNCSKPCRRNWLYGESLNKIIAHLPACENTEEEKCFEDVLQRVRKNIVDKPCTKLQYKGRHQTFNLEKNQSNTLVLAYRFANPPKMLVREEYLIYDGISMISAIGGTLGLFIGFSFNSFLRFIMKSFAKCRIDQHSIEDICRTDFQKQNVSNIHSKIAEICQQLNNLKQEISLNAKRLERIERLNPFSTTHQKVFD